MKNIIYKFYTTVLIGFTIINTVSAQNSKSFMSSPQLIQNPASLMEYKSETRKFTGISSLAVSSKGRLWAVWYAGTTPGEDLNNYVVIATSGNKGQSWEEVLVIDPDGSGPVRAFDPETWIDPDGKLWFFWAQAIDDKEAVFNNGNNAGVWALTTNDLDLEKPSWSEPRRLTNGIMMCKPIVLRTGEWILPVSTWRIKNGAKAVISTDHGMSWNEWGSVNVPESIWNADEHMIIERKNGSLWMLVRTQNGIGESISEDRGKTWSPLIPSRIQHPTARFFIHRLNSGNLLLVKHGPIDMKIGRSHLMAFISNDDGYSWSNGLLLDERTNVSYPDGQQAIDGTIYITYDYNRTKDQIIYLTSFTEDDIISGSDNKILEVYNRRLIVSKGGPK